MRLYAYVIISFALLAPPARADVGCFTQKLLEVLGTKQEAAFLNDRDFMKNYVREMLLDKGDKKPLNVVQSLFAFDPTLRLSPIDESALGKFPLDWKVTSQKLSTNGKSFKVDVFNSKSSVRHTIEMPWDPFWQKRYDYWNQPFLDFKNRPDFMGKWKNFKKGMKDSDLKLYYEAQKEAGDTSLQIRTATPSVILDVLVYQSENIKKVDPRLLQYLWQMREGALQTIDVMNGKNTKSLQPFLSAFHLRFPESETTWPLFTRQRDGVNMFTVSPKELAGRVGVTDNSALDAFSSFLALESDFAHFHGVSNSESIAYALNVLGDQSNSTYAIHYLDWLEAAKLSKNNSLVLPPQYKNAPEDILHFVLSGYDRELKLSPSQRNQLEEISRSVRSRTRYVFITDETSARISKTVVQHSFIDDLQVERLGFEDFDHFTLNGAMNIVESKNASEPLPVEMFTQKAGLKPIPIERRTNKPILEIGRFYVKPENRGLGPRQIWRISQNLVSKMDVEKIVAETTQAYAEELISKFGFKKVGERPNFAGELEYVIEATPESIFSAAFLNSPR